MELIYHPNCNCYRKSKSAGKFLGLNQTKDELESRFYVKQTANPYNITENVIFLGQIERKNDFEEKKLTAVDEKGEKYKYLDDSGIVIKTERGLIVLSGCAHSGICNIIEYAKENNIKSLTITYNNMYGVMDFYKMCISNGIKPIVGLEVDYNDKKITGDNRVISVIGGFHLKEVDENTLKTIEYMKQNDIGSIYLAHCTSDIVCQEFTKELPEKVKIIKTGLTYEF